MRKELGLVDGRLKCSRINPDQWNRNHAAIDEQVETVRSLSHKSRLNKRFRNAMNWERIRISYQ